MINLTLPYPPSSNKYWQIGVRGRGPRARGMMFKTPEARSYQEAAALIAMRQGVKPVAGEIVVHIDLYRPQKSGDLNNFIDVPFDALQGIAYANDKQIGEIHARRHDDPSNPRMELSIDHQPQLFITGSNGDPLANEVKELRARLAEIAAAVKAGDFFTARRLAGSLGSPIVGKAGE